MARPNLLLCFDAFGTLFRPKRNVALQYADIARQCGLTNFTDDELRSSFATAFKREATANPNYGRATGLGATQWWTNVINSTFNPFLQSGHSLPRDLAPRLLHRFSSDEGYAVEPDLASSLRALRTVRNSKHFSKIVTGVITNSDDRVPDVLSSFGFRVSPLRYGIEGSQPPQGEHDIDFHCISYDVGYEKPDQRIFTAAESMLVRVLEGKPDPGREKIQQPLDWLKVYVGDEYRKDIAGSTNAGWKAILLDPDHGSPQFPRVEDHLDSSLRTATTHTSILRAQSIQSLLSWLSAED